MIFLLFSGLGSWFCIILLEDHNLASLAIFWIYQEDKKEFLDPLSVKHRLNQNRELFQVHPPGPSPQSFIFLSLRHSVQHGTKKASRLLWKACGPWRLWWGITHLSWNSTKLLACFYSHTFSPVSLFDSGAALEGCLKKPSIFPSEFSFHSLFLSGKDGPKSFLFASQDGIYPLLTCRNKYQSHIYANSQRAAEKTASYRWKSTIREYFTVYHPAVERRDKYSRQKEQCIESPWVGKEQGQYG